MLVFMRFTFDGQLLTRLCRDEWLKIYDSEYVDLLIHQVRRCLPATRRLMEGANI